jgi:hypothetical protein
MQSYNSVIFKEKLFLVSFEIDEGEYARIYLEFILGLINSTLN